MNLEILKRARPPASTFDFSSASVGNLFLTGARLFSGSFESAIYLLGSICGVPSDLVRVIPAINSNFSHHISASLEDGTVIVGQNSISHPSEATALQPRPGERRPSLLLADEEEDASSASDGAPYEDNHLPGSLPSLRNKNINFSKSQTEDLQSRISRIWYINPYGQEIRPPANPRVLGEIRHAHTIIYSIGSLFTSLIPSLILRGVGKAILSSPARHKILILNGSIDRETGPPSHPFTAIDFIEAITRAGEDSHGHRHIGRYINKDTDTATTASALPLPYTSYVTHILYLEGPGAPKVDRGRLAEMGIETLRLYGRKITSNDGQTVVGVRYDSTALIQALEIVMGRLGGDDMIKGMLGGLNRRNTLENPVRK